MTVNFKFNLRQYSLKILKVVIINSYFMDKKVEIFIKFLLTKSGTTQYIVKPFNCRFYSYYDWNFNLLSVSN